MTHNWEKNQSIEINPQTVEKMELANKDIKIATWTMLMYLKENMNILERKL